MLNKEATESFPRPTQGDLYPIGPGGDKPSQLSSARCLLGARSLPSVEIM